MVVVVAELVVDAVGPAVVLDEPPNIEGLEAPAPNENKPVGGPDCVVETDEVTELLVSAVDSANGD